MSWPTIQYNVSRQELAILQGRATKHSNRSDKQNSGLGIHLSSLTKIMPDTRFGAYLSFRFLYRTNLKVV